MVRRLKDAHFTVTNWVDVELCRIAILKGEPLTVQRHHGYILDAKVRGDTLAVILKHTGPPQCDCKEEPPRHDDL